MSGYDLSGAAVLDCETTTDNEGWPIAEAVSIAVTDIHGDPLFNSLVKPYYPITLDAQMIHGISNEAVENAPTFAAVLPDLLRAIEDRPVYIYNRPFDTRILIQSAYLSGAAYPVLDRFFCAMDWYSAAFGGIEKSTGQPRRWKLTAAHELQFGHILAAHDALGDCRMTARLLRALNGDGPFRTIEDYPFNVNLKTYRLARTYKGDLYCSYATEGGLTVNVFGNQLNGLGAAFASYTRDRIVEALDSDAAEGETFLLDASVPAQIKFANGYAELISADPD